MKAAAKAAGVPANHVFLPATAPSGVGINEYYKSDEEYFHALAGELNKEYRAIVAAGMLVQVDDPFLPDIFFEPGLDDAQKKRRAQIYVEATNRALEGIPPTWCASTPATASTKARAFTKPRLSDIIEYVLKINAGSYSFEAANPRHEHEYHLFEKVKVPEGKVLCPGVITHASNIVEHPELIAERIVRFAKLVGRENVMAGADCGFSSQALYRTEVHNTVVWEKFKAMRAGRRHRDKDALEVIVMRDGKQDRSAVLFREEDMRRTLASAAALWLGAVFPAHAQSDVKIGFVTTFSGPAAAVGNDLRDGFELALDISAGRWEGKTSP